MHLDPRCCSHHPANVTPKGAVVRLEDRGDVHLRRAGFLVDVHETLDVNQESVHAVMEPWIGVVVCLPSETPAPAERELALKYLQADPNLRRGREDLCWALMNSREFMNNH